MQRYFVEPEQIRDQHVFFQGDDVHHICKVMRFKQGDQVIASNGLGQDFLVEFTDVSPDLVVGEIVEDIKDHRELPIEITLAQGLAKGEKMDWIIQKATELGVTVIQPFNSSRTIVKLNEKKEGNRIARWERIAKEAAEQAHRSRIPMINSLLSFEEIIESTPSYDLALIAYENESSLKLQSHLSKLSPGTTCLIIIGPEGGFSEEEIATATEIGVHSISLGKRILRTETAGIVALAYVGFYVEQLQQTP